MTSSNLSLKKITGEFYTPPFIVDLMIERIFHYLFLKNKIQRNSFRDFSESLTKLCFLDPAVGSGNFVIGLLGFIWKQLSIFTNSLEDKKALLSIFCQNNLFAIDINQEAINLCKKRIHEEYPFIKERNIRNFHYGNSLVETDVYEYISEIQAQRLLPFSWEEKFSNKGYFDVIIGNPPYFNLKKMGLKHTTVKNLFEYLKQSKRWEDKFRSSSDIYYFFVFLALNRLNNEGIFSFIIPNYWIDNTYADLLRDELQKFQILDIVDFDTVKIFKEEGRWLNISTCILTVQKSDCFQDILIYKNIPRNFFQMKKRNFASLSSYSYTYSQKYLNKEKWNLSPFMDKIYKIMGSQNLVTLGSQVTIAQGLSPGVKKLFVMTKEKSECIEIEEELLVPFLSNKDIQKWIINQEEPLVAILPSRITNLDYYPKAKMYLEENRKILLSGPDRQRLIKSNKIRWFDYSVYRNLALFEETERKILCPYRSRFSRFSFDPMKYFSATDTYALIAKDSDSLFTLLAILNSSSFDFWYREIGKKKGNMLEFFSTPLEAINIPYIEDKTSLNKLVQDLLTTYKIDEKSKEILELEKEINIRIAQEYGLELEFLEKYQKTVK